MNKLKKYWYVVVIILLVALLGLQKCKTDKLEDANQLQAVELSVKNDSVIIYRAKSGQLTSKLLSIQVERDNAKKALEMAGIDYKSMDVKWRNIVFALKGEIEAAGSGTTILRDTIFKNSVDTVFASAFKWNNRFLYLDGTIVDKNMKFNYQYRTPIDLISEKKGDKYIVSAYLGDPSALLTTANSITIVPKKRWKGWKYLEFGAGVTAGYLIFK